MKKIIIGLLVTMGSIFYSSCETMNNNDPQKPLKISVFSPKKHEKYCIFFNNDEVDSIGVKVTLNNEDPIILIKSSKTNANKMKIKIDRNIFENNKIYEIDICPEGVLLNKVLLSEYNEDVLCLIYYAYIN